MTTNVYVVADRGHDLSAAREFGEVVFLAPFVPNVFATDNMAKRLNEKLQDSRPEDYLLASGSLPVNMMAFGSMLLKHGKVNLLIFDPKLGRYVRRVITEDHLDPLEEGVKGGQNVQSRND